MIFLKDLVYIFPPRSVQEVLNRSKSNILSAIEKYGYSNFSLEILEYCNSKDTVVREQYYLDFLYPEYNILPVANSSLGNLHTEETNIKISNSLKGKSLSCASYETNQKMSESRTGKVFSVAEGSETKKILSDIRIGKITPFFNKSHSCASYEIKQKLSEAMGSKLEVFNKETNETIIYSSNYKAAEAKGCSEFTVRYYIKNKKLYKGKYLFKKSDESESESKSDTSMSQEQREKLNI